MGRSACGIATVFSFVQVTTAGLHKTKALLTFCAKCGVGSVPTAAGLGVGSTLPLPKVSSVVTQFPTTPRARLHEFEVCVEVARELPPPERVVDPGKRYTSRGIGSRPSMLPRSVK